MIVAIYARKSTDQGGVAGETRSVARQVEHAKAYAMKKGWTVAEDHVYVDDGVSGAEFANRPGFMRLMNVLTPQVPFDALVMSEESRLGREMVETMGALKQLVTAGVRVFYYLDDKERTLDSPIEKAMMALETFGAELERDKARQRVTDAMTQRARRGHWCGGTVFGYDRVEEFGEPDAAGKRVRQCVRLHIKDAEAEVVRDIFGACARGAGLRRISKRLNAEGAPNPQPRRGHVRGWAPSSVREVLYRPLYRGEIVWGKTKKRDKWGQKKSQPRPESEWVRASAPELRIVSDDEWTAAHNRLETSRRAYLRHTDGRVWGRPTNGVESNYLLVGMAVCGECGSGLMARPRRYGSRRGYFYTCGANWRRGDTVCANDLEIPMDMADAAVLDAVEKELLTPEVVEAAIERMFARGDEPSPDSEARRSRLGATLGKLDAELVRLTTAIAEGEASHSLRSAIREREAQREHVDAELRALDEPPCPEKPEALSAEALRHLDEWRGLLGQSTALTRQLLRKVLDDRLAFIPRSDGADRWYEFAGQATLEKYFWGIPQIKKALVAVRGIEPRSRG